MIPKQRPAVSGVAATVKVVGAFVPGVTKKAFEKYGFSAAALLMDWVSIVGRDTAAYTEPERLRWPRATSADDAAEAAGTGRPGATLVLRVEPSRALDVQYMARQLVERINSYFGYRAVAELRIVQGSVCRLKSPAAPAKSRSAQKAVNPRPAELAAVSDEKLRAALSLLGLGVAGLQR